MQVKCAFDAMVKISDLKLNPNNRNKHPKEQLQRLADILKYQGFRYPIKVSKLSGFVVSGHGRVAAAKILKIKEVPVNYQDYENFDQEYADSIADNSIASWSELDLSGINLDIPSLGPDLDINLLGIKDFSIDADYINKGDENSEWVDMPEFEAGENDIKLTIFFTSENQRKDFVEDHSIEITKKQNNQWSVRL